MATIEIIKASLVYKQIVSESYGGIMYMNSPNKYDSEVIEELWLSLSDDERDSQDGIVRGVFNFLKLDK